MKKSILTVLCIATLIACKKSETTTLDSTTDSTSMMAPTDSSMMMTDSTGVSGMNNDVTDLSDQDKKFADEAAMGGMMEVLAGQLAATNGTNAEVKAHGEMMVNDHTKANDELKSWATGIGYNLPMTLDAAKQRKYDDLKAKTGADFDRAYADLMVSDHKEAIDKFRKQTTDGKEASLKAFATKTLPALEHHLTKTEAVRNAVK